MIPNITLGADPEIIFRTHKEKRLINAITVIDDFIYDTNKNRKTTDRNVLAKYGKFGCDGHQPICELRPDPTDTPKDMVEEIRSLLFEAYKRNPDIQNLEWVAGSYPNGKPLGGHVHLGGVHKISNEVIDLFDGILATLTICMEDPEEAVTRHNADRNGYGRYGHLAIDDPKHAGPNGHYRQLKIANAGHGIEYKTLSSWMASPGIALGIFAITKAIGIAILNGDIKEFTKADWDLLKVDRNAFYSCDKEKFYPKIGPLFQLMQRKFSYFKASPHRFFEVRDILRRSSKGMAEEEIVRKMKSEYRSTVPIILDFMTKSNVVEYDAARNKYLHGEFFTKMNDSLPVESFSGMSYWKNVMFLKQVIEQFKVWDHNTDLKIRWGLLQNNEIKDYMSVTSKEYTNTTISNILKKKKVKKKEPEMVTGTGTTTIQWERM